MPRTLLLPALVLSFLVCLAVAAEAADEPSGEILYRRYCASCHGVDARGDGPAASALKQPPPDLTTVAERAGGRFDEKQMMAIIDGERIFAAHGSREMPVWGVVFDKELEGAPYGTLVRFLRAQVLADYLRTLQR